MNGRQQVEALARLANPQPEHINGIRIGDQVRLPNLECSFEVIGLADPLLILKSPSGRELKAGWRAVQRIRTRVEIGR